MCHAGLPCAVLTFVVNDICPALLGRMPSPGFEQLSLESEEKLLVKLQDVCQE